MPILYLYRVIFMSNLFYLFKKMAENSVKLKLNTLYVKLLL